MDNQSYTYKCPSCGSAIGFDSEKNVWKCQYCKNEYNNLFLTPMDDLEDVEDYSNYYYYYCDKCKTSFYSKTIAHSCYRCDNSIKGTKEKLGGTINTNYSEKDAALVLLKELTKYRDFLPSEYLNNIHIDHKYIMCDLYSGSVIISNGKEEVKYFFVNTIIPRIDTDNYRVLYDFANAGFNSVDNYVRDPKYNYVVEKTSHDIVNEFDDVKTKIIEACKFTFLRTHSQDLQITITEDLSVKSNLLLRTYYSSFVVNGEEHKCYIFGYNKLTKMNQLNRCSLDFPPIPDKSNDDLIKTIDELRLKSNSLASIIAVLVSLLIFVFIILMFVFTATFVEIPSLIIMTIFLYLFPCIIVLIIFGIISLFIKKLNLDKLIRFYKMSVRANEKDFYYNLVNNSNFVKKVGR